MRKFFLDLPNENVGLTALVALFGPLCFYAKPPDTTIKGIESALRTQSKNFLNHGKQPRKCQGRIHCSL
jgi:hypothetical protein